jgi:hypothetical protein
MSYNLFRKASSSKSQISGDCFLMSPRFISNFYIPLNHGFEASIGRMLSPHTSLLSVFNHSAILRHRTYTSNHSLLQTHRPLYLNIICREHSIKTRSTMISKKLTNSSSQQFLEVLLLRHLFKDIYDYTMRIVGPQRDPRTTMEVMKKFCETSFP